MQQELAKRCGYAFAGWLSGTAIGFIVIFFAGYMDARFFDSIAETLALPSAYLLPFPFGIFFAIWGFFDGEGMISPLESIWDGIYR